MAADAISGTLYAAMHTPLPAEDDPPRVSYIDSDASARESKYSSHGGSLPLLVGQDKIAELGVKPPDVKSKKRLLALLIFAALALAIIILAVILPVYFTVIKPKNSHDSPASVPGSVHNPDNHNGSSTGSSPVLTTGGDGSTVTTDDGSTFTYTNKFGGFCEYLSYFHCGNRFSGCRVQTFLYCAKLLLCHHVCFRRKLFRAYASFRP